MRTLALLCLAGSLLSAQTITTIAGGANAGFSGDNGPATAATINQPVNVATDSSGNVYVTDQLSHRIRKIDTNGIITTFAGNGTAASTGDGGQATNASINTPTGVAVGPDGSVYICEVAAYRVRKVDSSGKITTVAGNGVKGDSGDGGPATAASFSIGIRVALDANNNLYIVDQGAARVRKVDGTSGVITNYAGNGAQSFGGDGGPATSAMFNNPTAVALDPAGNLFITDQFNHRIRRVDAATKIITTVAGNGSASYSGDGGPAVNAALNYPGCVVIEAGGSLVISDTVNYRIRRVGTDGNINTIAGTGVRGFSGDNGPALNAQISDNFGITRDTPGNLYFTEGSANGPSNRVRKIASGVTGAAPVFTAAGVTNAASFVSGISPGTLATIFGTNLSRGVNGFISASMLPLPTSLGGTSITVGGFPAPIFSVVNSAGSEQLSFLVPFEIAGQTSVPVIVNNGAAASAPASVAVSAALPGVFTADNVTGIVVHGADNTLITAASPAKRGEVIVIYATGLGPVTPPLASGSPAPTTVLTTTAFTPSITIGGAGAGLIFSGLTPGFVGLYQINAMVSSSAATGNVDLVVTVNGIAGKAVKIVVQ